ncbi:hypothetical protein GGI08_003151 [Coemansia sp. S2]|nr:hypothetical protein GGI08_003151 [Coemansia sp. S2]KAJ2345638.1 hypothetical protein GGH92_003962 [Coemansia sp. RSA 2673]
MSWPLGISSIALLLGVGIQCYVLSYSAQLAGNSEDVRYVTSNELTLLWSSLSGTLSSWTAGHLLVRAHCKHPNDHRTRIIWLPVGVISCVVLWAAFIGGLAALAVGTTTLLYKQECYLQSIWSIANHVFPILSAVVTLPCLAKELCRQRNVRSLAAGVGPTQIETQSVVTLATIDSPRCPASPESTSARSEKSEVDTVAGSTNQAIHDAEKLPFDPPLTTHPEYDIQTPMANETSKLAKLRDIAQLVAQSLRTLVGHSTLASTTAALSVALSALLFNSALQRYRHVHTSPHGYAALVHTTTRFQDDVVRPVTMAIRCTGRPPLGIADSRIGRPQKATIIIEHAIGYPSLVSQSLHAALVAQNHRVCTYDRPGYMLSPQGYAPIAPDALEQALASALHYAGEKAPFYVVGHHSGSEYAHLLANARPEQVVGMSFIYPTAAALRGLLAGITKTAVGSSLSEAMASVGLLSEADDSVASLNGQRAICALGLPPSTSSAIAGIHGIGQSMIGWALSGSDLAQAQYFEMSQRANILDAINSTRPVMRVAQKLPVLLFGVSDAGAVQDSFMAAVDDHYAIEISDKVEGQSLALERMAMHISRHIELVQR